MPVGEMVHWGEGLNFLMCTFCQSYVCVCVRVCVCVCVCVREREWVTMTIYMLYFVNPEISLSRVQFCADCDKCPLGKTIISKFSINYYKPRSSMCIRMQLQEKITHTHTHIYIYICMLELRDPDHHPTRHCLNGHHPIGCCLNGDGLIYIKY